ncbi:hypothetical protein V490_08343, partial [Pseudogymnoascus sp. VKM F-3557]
MTATEDSSPPPASARITLSRKGSRKKTPEGFTMDSNADENVSPTKPAFADSSMDEQAFDDHNTNTNTNDKTANRLPSLGNLPALPQGESSIMSLQSEDMSREEHSDGHPDTMDESEMRRHLNDVESSFLPAPSPVGQAANPGVDDT